LSTTAILACAEPQSTHSTDDRALELVATLPAPGTLEISRRPGLALCFSNFLDPSSVDEQDFWISSGAPSYDVFVEHELVAYRDPDDAAALAKEAWCAGSILRISPRSILAANTRYRLHVRGDNLRGWAGQRLVTKGAGWFDVESEIQAEGEDPKFESAYYLEFSTDAADIRPNTQNPRDAFADLTLRRLFEPGHAFNQQKGSCSCHQGSGELARSRLDLSTPEAAQMLFSSRITATGYPMVAASEPASSYLIQKLVRQSDGSPLPYVSWGAMPPLHEPDYAILAELSAWIAAGARR
jgi:hypothetical protein